MTLLSFSKSENSQSWQKTLNQRHLPLLVAV